jgi:hypothetical protein
MKKEKEERKHPSFGQIGWSRVRGLASCIGRSPSEPSNNLFMSSLQHDGWIEIEIKGARKIREVSNTRVSSASCPTHIRVAMTEAQFASFVTTPNSGDGVPCTITRLNGDQVEDCPEDEEIIQFRQDLYGKAQTVLNEAEETLAKVNVLLGTPGSVKKRDLKEVKEGLMGTLRELGANMPYLLEQFNEYMDSVYFDACARFEGRVRSRAEQLGLQAMQEGPGALDFEE